jgi:hypothetical protein
LRILLSAVAEGHLFEISEPANGEALEPLRSVLDPLQNAIGEAIDHPVRSLTVAIELPDGVARSGGTPVVVHLRNAGEQGAWVANPLTLPNVADRDRAELIYRKPMVFTPGIAPAPEPLNRATAAAANEDGGRAPLSVGPHGWRRAGADAGRDQDR